MKCQSGCVKGVIFGFVAGAGLCLFLGPCSGCKTLERWWNEIMSSKAPESQVLRMVPCKEIVDDIRAIWSYERNYAYRHKSLAASIGEMGDGTGIGKNGFVLKPAIWASRIDDDNATPEPVSYKVKNPATGTLEIARYRFGVFPVKLETGERDLFSVVIVSVPEKPAGDDACFIALCGPVNLQNDFTFDKEWPVFQLKAAATVVQEIRNLQSATHDELKSRLATGNLAKYVTKTFNNLYYPQEEGHH